ncbi:MAG: metallophosphoesterase family protein [Streptosporangiaceae bacterium]
MLSDIHSNVFALQAVLKDIEADDADGIWVCGDTFGYYPWATETFRLLSQREHVAVLGNHDAWIAARAPAPGNVAGEIAMRNALSLREYSPAALEWLAELALVLRFAPGDWKISMTHGTPDDPLDGRYYPDDARAYRWLPRPGEILLLGQTHYPILRGDASQGLMLNPGSVGQPRDGNPMPSWALLDLATGQAQLRRTTYDNISVMARLDALGWDSRVTRALAKR